jgi:L-amino acid N-acyltransferase YncA
MLTDAYPKTVALKDGTNVVIRPLAEADFDPLFAFFGSLADEDRIFLRNDVRDPDVVRSWTENVDPDRVIPLVAFDGAQIVGNGSLHFNRHHWTQHVGNIRLVTARSHRNKGLGGLITRELVALAEERNIEKLQAQVISDSVGAVRMFETLGFKTVAVLEGMVKDRTWKSRDLAVMVSDVSNLTQVMEEWLQEAMLPSHRVPGDGA